MSMTLLMCPVNPHRRRNYPAKIAKIICKGQHLPDSVYIGGAFCKVKLHILNPISAKTTADSDIHHTLPSLCLNWQCHTNYPSTKCICANCTQQQNVFFRGYPIYKFELEVAALYFKHGLTLKEARQEARLSGFQQIPFSLSASPLTLLGPHLALPFPLLHPILLPPLKLLLFHSSCSFM